jgi:hypothetical protein
MSTLMMDGPNDFGTLRMARSILLYTFEGFNPRVPSLNLIIQYRNYLEAYKNKHETIISNLEFKA